MLLIAGGSTDPHIDRWESAARRLGVSHTTLRIGPGLFPRLTLSLHDGSLHLDNERLAPHALLIRHDIFEWVADPRPEVSRRARAWWETLAAWALTNPEVRSWNRAYFRTRTNKLHALHLARQAGLRIPDTIATNDHRHLRDGDKRIAKPIAGGGPCVALTHAIQDTESVHDALPSPAIVQPRLHAPELRVYFFNDQQFVFEVRSKALDHRTDDASTVHPAAPLPTPMREALARTALALGLDHGAADFKTCPINGEPVFLEINSQPMWEAYDIASSGLLAETFITGLGLPSP